MATAQGKNIKIFLTRLDGTAFDVSADVTTLSGVLDGNDELQNEFLFGLGICSKCGAKDLRFDASGDLLPHNDCDCRVAVKPVGILAKC